MPSWDDLRLFLTCYRAGSATRAARLLDTPVSPDSRRLDRLEAELGAALFLRGTDGLVPTDAAERMLPAAQEAERNLAAALGSVGSASPEVEGLVRFAATTDLANFVLLPMMGPLLERYPRLRVQMVLGTELSDLSRREADLAVRIGVPGEAGDLVIRHLRDEPMRFYASAGYLERYPESLPPERHRWIGMSEEFSGTGVEHWLRTQAPEVRTVFASSDFTSVRLAAGAGLGVTLLPEMYGRITPGLRRLDWSYVLAPAPLFLVTHRSTHRSPAVRAVWDFVLGILVPVPGRDDVAIVRAALADAYGLGGWED